MNIASVIALAIIIGTDRYSLLIITMDKCHCWRYFDTVL